MKKSQNRLVPEKGSAAPAPKHPARTSGIIGEAISKMELPTLESLRLNSTTKRGMEDKLRAVMNLKIVIADAKSELDEIMPSLYEQMIHANAKSLAFQDYRFTAKLGVNVSLNRQRLIAAGVDPMILEECTRRTEYETVEMKSLTAKGKGEEEE